MKSWIKICLLFMLFYSVVCAQNEHNTITIKGAIQAEKTLNGRQTLLFYGILPGDKYVAVQTDEKAESYQLKMPKPSSGFISLKCVIKGHSEMEAYINIPQIESDEIEYTLSFKPKEYALEGVYVQGNRGDKTRYTRFMRDVEGMQILAGKKSTVSITENMLFNKAANNTRQMFRDISGIVIHEGGDGGLQLNIGSRGLNPNRSANFNMRQNGYDISADPLGYPESYYTPNADDVKELQVLRGASALQYGSQFGGMINFKLAQAPKDKRFDLRQHLSVGSYGFVSSYTRVSGSASGFSYYLSSTLKRGDGYRPNSDLKSYSVLGQFSYKPNSEETWSLDWLKYHYLEHQPGGLTDVMFNQDPRQSNRARNWFLIDWNIASLTYQRLLPAIKSEWSVRAMGLYANRFALGYRDKRVSTPDPGHTERDLQKGIFRNWGAETKFLKRFYLPRTNAVSSWLIGGKYYQANNISLQGAGSIGKDADFNLYEKDLFSELKRNSLSYSSAYTLPNLNFALFSETILRINRRWSIIPGFRLEYIRTGLDGMIKHYSPNLGSGPQKIGVDELKDDKTNSRTVFLMGIATAYQIGKSEIYANLTQNYRAITFNDMRTISPALEVNPSLKDERGFSSDVGIRSKGLSHLSYDLSAYFLYYGHRIGEYFRENPQAPSTYHRYRDNIGSGISYGVEGVCHYDLKGIIPQSLKQHFYATLFANIAITGSRYLKSDAGYQIEGNTMEFVPLYNMRGGINLAYKRLSLAFQTSFTSFQFTDATNEAMDPNDAVYGIYGAIPGYCIMDLNMGYNVSKRVNLTVALQNIGNTIYMTRRATGYPGPGIIPSAPFNMMATIQYHL